MILSVSGWLSEAGWKDKGDGSKQKPEAHERASLRSWPIFSSGRYGSLLHALTTFFPLVFDDANMLRRIPRTVQDA